MLLEIKTYQQKISLERYLRDTIINFQKYDTWKSQSTIAINFISSKGIKEERVMYSTSGNIEFVTILEIIQMKVLINSLSQFFHNTNLFGSEISMRGSDFIFDLVPLLY